MTPKIWCCHHCIKLIKNYNDMVMTSYAAYLPSFLHICLLSFSHVLMVGLYVFFSNSMFLQQQRRFRRQLIGRLMFRWISSMRRLLQIISPKVSSRGKHLYIQIWSMLSWESCLSTCLKQKIMLFWFPHTLTQFSHRKLFICVFMILFSSITI